MNIIDDLTNAIFANEWNAGSLVRTNEAPAHDRVLVLTEHVDHAQLETELRRRDGNDLQILFPNSQIPQFVTEITVVAEQAIRVVVVL